MIYVYPELRTRYNQYIKNNDRGATRRFQKYGINSIADLYQYENKSEAMEDFLMYYERNIPTGNNPCVVNRICWLAEKECQGFTNQKSQLPSFDYTILKSNVGYAKRLYEQVKVV